MRAALERDLYLALLDLGFEDEVEPLLRRALCSIVEATRAQQGYIEVRDDPSSPSASWSMAHGLNDDEVSGVRAIISRGVIAETIATGDTVLTPSAVLDPRFIGSDSVRRASIGAVLCAPIGDPPVGVLYLQGWEPPDVCSDDDRRLARTFSRHMVPLVDHLLARKHRKEERDSTRDARRRLSAAGVIGRSHALAFALEQAALLAPLDITVLLTGESGTGKSQLARVIHDNSPRAPHPFVEINCAALPENLFESEFFGALPGAHSTAVRRIEGKVSVAARGTLFLDEIGDLTLGSQGKLLQLLQSHQYYPLAATRPETADVRIIAATNIDLERAVAEKRFREDLFYRLQVMPLRVPSLEERRDDIPDLVAFACRDVATRYKLPCLSLSPSALRAAEAASWPGNVRQLVHTVQAAIIRAAGERMAEVQPRHLFPGHPGSDAAPATSFQEQTRRFHARILRETLEQADWNVSETARRLDLTRAHVYNLIKAFGLSRAR